jgi:AcrR family transcriptional regulator
VPVKAPAKLTSEARRAAIIKAVRRVFADKGFHGTTTRELAEAAGVSEALLFKHFPNKEALYAAMHLSCCGEQKSEAMDRLQALDASASSLVVLVHLMVTHMLAPPTQRDDAENLQNRLLLRSLTEDGEFARQFLQGMPSLWVGKVEECLKAAIAAGDAVNGAVGPRLRGWFGQHLGAMLMVHLLPAKPVVDYGVHRDKLIEQAVWFILRGMGLKDETIKRCYNPKLLAMFAS